MTAITQTQQRLSGDLVRGAVGGLVAGVIFAVATMWFTTSIDMPARTPLLMISTIVLGDDAMTNGDANSAVGWVVHLALSIAFGIVFALIARRMRTNGEVALAGFVYGGLLYVLNFQILARVAFETFKMANQPFEVVVHLVFGVLLGFAFYNSGQRRRERLFGLGTSRADREPVGQHG
jgi:uncharacterized membrane protein YagU involved in acid resistance